MRRRTVGLLLAVLATAAQRTFAQGSPRQGRIAFLVAGLEAAVSSRDDLIWLKQGLVEEGLSEGADFTLDVLYADGDYSRFPVLVAELLSRRPSAIVVTTIASARAAQALSTTVPIVMMGLNDPVGVGLVASLARPGGNITGIATLNEDLQLKMLQMMRELLPRTKAVAFVWNPGNASNVRMLANLRAKAAEAGIDSSTVEIPDPQVLESAFSDLARRRPDVVFVIPDVGLVALARRIVMLATEHRVPVIGGFYGIAEAGGILSYESRRAETVRLMGGYLRRLLAGSKPTDLPISQPTVFRLTINVKAAASFGLTVPVSLLARAGDVIE